jgi:hypothetical protein
MKAEVLQERTDWENLCQLATPEGVTVSALRSPQYQQYSGQTVAQIAAALGKEWPDVVMDLVHTEQGRIGAMYFIASEENLAMQMRQPWIKFGTDAGGIDPAWAAQRGLTHPRAYGTYPRILGRYVRDEGALPLEDAVRKASSAVADRLGLRDRGLLRDGLAADIVVFDPATVTDRATYTDPHHLSEGIRDVFVNGVAVLRDGEHTGAMPGQRVNGKLTLGENIADLGGLNVAYTALQKASEGKPDPKIDGLSRDQRFFLNFGTVWRRSFTDKELKSRIATDEHAPANFRAIGAPSNMPEFAAAFSCKAGDPMVRGDGEKIVIW